MIEKIATKADISLAMPVLARLKARVKEIQKLSQAKIVKVPVGNTHRFVTEPPKMFISGFEASMQNGVGIISYTKYKTDKTGNKVLEERTATFTDRDGNKRERIIDANYVLDIIIVERIEKFKPLKTEKIGA